MDIYRIVEAQLTACDVEKVIKYTGENLVFLYMKNFPVQISHIYNKETMIRKEKL